MKFSKYNNPSRKRKRKRNPYSAQYIKERKQELMTHLTEAKTDNERQILIEAYRVCVNPCERKSHEKILLSSKWLGLSLLEERRDLLYGR